MIAEAGVVACHSVKEEEAVEVCSCLRLVVVGEGEEVLASTGLEVSSQWSC